MELLVVTAARFDASKLVALKVGRYHMTPHVWIAEPEQATVPAVVRQIESGRRAFTMLEKEGQRLPGQELHIVNDGTGALTVAPVAVKAGAMLEDLPAF